MEYLVDTNILLRLVQRNDPLNSVIRNAARKLKNDGNIMLITPQNCAEFWNVATRPATKNGFGLTPKDADRQLRLIERIFPLLSDVPTVYPEWRKLVVKFGVSGVQVHDARLAATMKANNITYILTFNTVDFIRYTSEGIIAVNPGTV
ncbi:MAG: type II toxin-antitoxin system VapC family toxin [Aphanizomenon flos-aquae KM1D3_PB]|uniref:type II toxin-antitoxin system VapC family toxin n=1 Tax=Aphanizomenon flos-aquae TaxID=1176 RepID=UPI0005438D30|nr:type II toxin-antitoxin system VapC family toxin [Aphanizomenon flos-aquae]KHG41840.1 twitching motility protein PilT [Aphanizomenon flos-aquae 2012/KM1/D3]QSV69968.1 MAG: type II toxin-antitoxin system VapC family toxin [Aphanizomenon flos-aquae KM1D3_PB]